MELLEGTNTADRPQFIMAGELSVISPRLATISDISASLVLGWGLTRQLHSLDMESGGALTDEFRIMLCQRPQFRCTTICRRRKPHVWLGHCARHRRIIVNRYKCGLIYQHLSIIDMFSDISQVLSAG